MDKKITIGLFIDTYYPMVDGVVTVVDNYAKNLIKYANVIVFAPEVPGRKYVRPCTYRNCAPQIYRANPHGLRNSKAWRLIFLH